jgi:hypothetical protein
MDDLRTAQSSLIKAEEEHMNALKLDNNEEVKTMKIVVFWQEQVKV